MSARETKKTVKPLEEPTPVERKVEAESLEEPEPEGEIKLAAKGVKEGEGISIKKSYVVNLSGVVKIALDEDPKATEIKLGEVTPPILDLIVEYLEHHKGVVPEPPAKPLKTKEMKGNVKDPWDAEFIDRVGNTRQTLYDLISAANYLEIKSLIHLGVAKVASLLKGEAPDKLREILGKGISKPGGAGKPEAKKPEGKGE
jgi:S-phase kinase-associated protein 1